MQVEELLKDPEVQQQFALLKPEDQTAWAWRANWLARAHRYQVVPPGDWWTIWLMLAGRGAGKTRTAAEQIAWWAWTEPGTRWLVGAPTSSDVRATCFEGDSGLISIVPQGLIADYNRAFHEIKLINGSLIKGIPASEPERFRGPQFHGAWCCIPGTKVLMADGSERNVEDVTPGQSVMTRHGPRNVLRAGASHNPNELVTIDCGETSLTVTVDHPILVDDRWVAAGDIQSGDALWVTSTSAVGTLTESSMSGTTVSFQADGLYITRMRTKVTMPLKTWWRCLRQNISACIEQVSPTQTLKSRPQLKHLSGFGHQNLPAAFIAMANLSLIPQINQGNFVAALAWKNGALTSFNRKQGAVWFAASFTWLRNLFKDIAPNPATPDPRFEPIALTQQAVRSVKRSPNSKTYNLTVDGEHEFIANGIVVHNCDELAAWDYLQEAWDQIMFGVRLGKKTRIVATTTPKPKDLIIELVGREGEDVTVTRASTYANLANLAPSFQKQILQYEGTRLGRQEIYAEIIDPEESGIVKRDMFKLWPAGRAFPKFEYIVQSYDCASTEKTVNDPTACITFGVFKPMDGPMSAMIIDCWQDRLQYPDLRPKVIEEYETVYGEGKERKRVDLILVEDKSAGIALIQDLQRAHLPVRAYNPGRADKIQRLNIVSNIIARGRVWIPESDRRSGYVKDWAEGFVSQICAFPDTTHDDYVDSCLDSLTQIQMIDGHKAIKDVRVGDMVMTPNGPRCVIAVHDNGHKEVWEVVVGTRRILATADHRIMTAEGWKKVDSLSETIDNGYVIREKKSWHSRKTAQWLKRWSLTASGTTDTLRVLTQLIGDTLRGLVLGSTVMSGSSTTAQFPKACMSIILTVTRAITTSATWLASHVKSIGDFTQKSYLPAIGLQSSASTLTAYGPRHLNGINQKRAENGTEGTPSRLYQNHGANPGIYRKLLCGAFGAVKKQWQKAKSVCFAHQRAKTPNLDSELVNRVQNTHTTRHVFDLTVEGEHCYFANGVLVHNCTQALRFLRDSGWLEIDPPREELDEDDYADAGVRRENPYAQ